MNIKLNKPFRFKTNDSINIKVHKDLDKTIKKMKDTLQKKSNKKYGKNKNIISSLYVTKKIARLLK